MGCGEEIKIMGGKFKKTHMCGGQPSLVSYLSFALPLF